MSEAELAFYLGFMAGAAAMAAITQICFYVVKRRR